MFKAVYLIALIWNGGGQDGYFRHTSVYDDMGSCDVVKKTVIADAESNWPGVPRYVVCHEVDLTPPEVEI